LDFSSTVHILSRRSISLFFAAMMVLQFFVVLFFYPETKGATLEQLQHCLGIE